MSFGGGRRKVEWVWWITVQPCLISQRHTGGEHCEDWFLQQLSPSLVVIILNFKAVLLRLLPPNRKELHNPLLLAFFLHPSVCFSTASFSARTETHASSLATFTKNAGKKDQMQKCRTSGGGAGFQAGFKVCLQIFKPAGRRRCQFKFRNWKWGTWCSRDFTTAVCPLIKSFSRAQLHFSLFHRSSAEFYLLSQMSSREHREMWFKWKD